MAGPNAGIACWATASETGEGFQRRYYDALQRQPAVVMAHADVRRVIKSMR